MKKLFGVWFIFVIVLNVGLAWVVGSTITSGIKAMTEGCGQRYVVESVLQGDWFCPTKE